jgi:tryptophan synthase alpha chain
VSQFFAERGPGELGLAVFLNAGDPPLDELKGLVLLLDACGVDCLELAVPFPNSASDGPVIRRSARRALAEDVDLSAVLAFVEAVRPRLARLKIALLADWSHTVKSMPLGDFLGRVRSAGADGLLVHGVPPRVRPAYHEAAHLAGQPIVTTCYASSEDRVLDQAARHGSAYVYLVARYGRTGGSAPPDPRALAPVMLALRSRSEAPIAVGFGVKGHSDLEVLREAGADAAIVGSAFVSCVERAVAGSGDIVGEVERFLGGLGRFG